MVFRTEGITVEPYNVVVGPAEVFLAGVGESFPDTDEAPAGNWASLGDTEGGVVITFTQTANPIRSDQATGPLKFVRSEEDCSIMTPLAEMTAENLGLILNKIVATDVAPSTGVPGSRVLKLWRGIVVQHHAMLIRIPSSYGDYYAQYEFPVVAMTGSPSTTHVKDDKTVLEAEWMAVEDRSGAEDERFGRFRSQDAPAL